jgi:tetratricopeptide (TPR) repeat protein
MPQARLFLTHEDIYFEGKKHEVPNLTTEAWVPSSIFMVYHTSRYGQEKRNVRFWEDRNDFMQQIEEDPKNSRATFYLGRTEQWLGHNHIAYHYLKKRTEMQVYPEETFSAMYNLGMVTECLSYEDPGNYSWEEALGYYLKAYTMRPHRAEPLIRIAEHCLNEGHYETAYLFARRAIELPEPDIATEMLPLDRDDYTFSRWEVFSRCAWYVGDFKLGEKAAKLAIEAYPNDAYLYANLASYWNKK